MGFWGFGEQYVTERSTTKKQLHIAPQKPQNPNYITLKFLKYTNLYYNSLNMDSNA